MDIILVKMEKDSEDFYRRLIELAMEYGYTARRENCKTNNIFVGDLMIIPSKRQVLVNGKEVFFTGKEFDILELLAVNMGQVFMWMMDILVPVWNGLRCNRYCNLSGKTGCSVLW